ncbi:MAG: hypothetical protein CEO22_131 [Candidatus Berkelbacteria bacterium Gr01-1014_85]|uniref:Zn-dependent hydrolase of the beta-lactamase fold-like protein n=1 Tax=Candidatus Berkelbacteria bacterium Gr01-1014_85 TaxID=2017150 RepID=A0A554JD90_9BACT|nr:MAG: hypothetical protein CEO22_131 [Candidatus Berkelbacteria bacterium Gr01-1014_85]
MLIKRLDPQTLQLKGKSVTIELGQTVTIAGHQIESPGEYELSGVSLEWPTADVRLVRFEDCYILQLYNLNRLLTDEELEQVGIATILILPVGGTEAKGLEPKMAVEVMNQIDPSLVILNQYESVEPFRTAYPKGLEVAPELKITNTTLPEERQVYVIDNV